MTRSYVLRLPVLGLLALLQVISLYGMANDQTRNLDQLLLGKPSAGVSPEALEVSYARYGLQWLSDKKDRARFFGKGLELCKGGLKPEEIVVAYQQGKLANVDVSLYNRADSRESFRSEKDFIERVEEIKKIWDSELGVVGKERKSTAGQMVKMPGWLYDAGDYQYLLEYSCQREMRSRDQEFKPEFIRLRMHVNFDHANGGTELLPERATRSDLPGRVTKSQDGDVVISTVPMVDQGPKGYCAVATVERVMRYYGMSVDQHELAQLAGTESEKGTNPAIMMDALRAKQGKLKLRARDLIRFEWADYERMIKDYNRLVKTSIKGGGTGLKEVADAFELFEKGDGALLKKVRVERGKGDFLKFERLVQASIDRGEPLIWSVQLGLFPEEKLSQLVGGHMRLLIGYNLKSREVIYSDTWGMHHAFKKMPSDQAWTITTGLGVISPSN